MSGDRIERQYHADVLLVVADAGLRQSLLRMLTDDGHAARDAGDRVNGLNAIEALAPDLAIVALEPAETRAFLAALDGHPVRGSMALIGIDTVRDSASMFAAGVDDVVVLPVQADAFRLAVLSVLRLKSAERTSRALMSRTAREQRALRRASDRLLACHSLTETASAAAEIVRANLGYDRVNIALYDEATQSLQSVVTTDAQGRIYGPPEVALTINLAPGSALLDLPAFQAIFDNGAECFYFPETFGRAPAYFRPFLDGPVRETLIVSLRSGERIEGLLTVDNAPTGRPFGPVDEGVLLELAALVGQTMARTRMAEALELRAREAQALAAAGDMLAAALEPNQVHEQLLDAARTLIDYDHAMMLLCDGAWARAVASRGGTLHPGTTVIDLEGTSGRALAEMEGKALRVSDTAQSSAWHDFPLWAGEHTIRSIILAPLFHEEVMVACLCVAAFRPNAFTARQQELAAILAARASVALRNARLYRAAVDRAGADLKHDDRGGDGQAHGAGDQGSVASEHVDTSFEQHVPIVSGDAAPGHRYEQVVDNLRLLSLLDSGTLELNPATIPVREVVQNALHAVPEALRDRHVTLHGPEDLLAVADMGRAVEILSNVLDNAIRYSVDAAPITVAWSNENGQAIIRVQDQGSGIQTQSRKQLFTRFGWMPGPAASRAPKGIGLGLYLGRTLAEMMGGALDLESTSSKGSLIRLSLPMPPD